MTLAEDYRLIHESAAIGATSERRQIAISGGDRASYLQGLLTNDIVALSPGTGCYSAWLSPQGRMLTDMHVLQSESLILLDVPADVEQATVARLEQFIFSEDVQVASLSAHITGVWVHGPLAADIIERVLTGAVGLSAWLDYQHQQFRLVGPALLDGPSPAEPALSDGPGPVGPVLSDGPRNSIDLSVARIDQLGVPGFCLYVERTRAANLVAALENAGAHRVGTEALTAARIEAGYPLFGVDMNDATIPLEAGIEQRAISFSKGCYVGQEVIIRVLHRGHGRVARKLVSLRFEGAVPEGGSKLHAGDKEIGHVTSVAESPRLGSIGLGYVHRDFTAAGTTLREAIVS